MEIPGLGFIKVAKPQEQEQADRETLERYTAHFRQLLSERFKLPPDRENERSFAFLTQYMAHYCAALRGKGKMPCKGLFLYGRPGTGKTAVMQAFCAIFPQTEFYTVWELSRVFGASGINGLYGLFETGENFPMVIDDLGNETAVKSFGTPLPMADIIRTRAERFYETEPPILTFFTSNVRSNAEIVKLYGESVFSRLAGMVDFLEWRGADHRLKGEK